MSQLSNLSHLKTLGRRDVLRAVAWVFLVWGWAICCGRAPPPRAQPSAATFGRAKSCILLFMWGGPAHQDTWDLKPQAPAEIRGEFQPIATKVPGIQICEHFPQLADRVDRLAIVRSMTHTDVDHLTGTHYLLTGQPPPKKTELRGDWPHVGAVLARLGRGRDPLPPFVSLRPKLENDVPRFVEQSHGQSAGWLGQAFDPLSIDANPADADYHVGDFHLPPEISVARLDSAAGTSAGLERAAQPPRRRRGIVDHGPACPSRVRHAQFGHRQEGLRSDRRAAGDARALWSEPARAIGAASAAAGRAGRAAGDRVLAQRRHEKRERLLGHAQSQFHRPARRA